MRSKLRSCVRTVVPARSSAGLCCSFDGTSPLRLPDLRSATCLTRPLRVKFGPKVRHELRAEAAPAIARSRFINLDSDLSRH